LKLLALAKRALFAPPFLPLYLALCYARLTSRKTPNIRTPGPWGSGVSVLIPECGTPDLLEITLRQAQAALGQLAEPVELVVMVNGAPRDLYRELEAAYPHATWLFTEQALGFNGAIAAGLQAVTLPCVYLLNSDMRLAPDALQQLLPWRFPAVFALASQIFMPADKRREETGWSDFYLQGGRSVTFERDPGTSMRVRGSLYASGGSSLFRTDILREYVQDSQVYSPFYWEDAEWGARAWAEGMECLFVPASTAIHEHRATISQKFAAAEIERISDRNALQFELRNHLSWLDGLRAIAHLTRQPAATRKELATLNVARGVAARRQQSIRAQRQGFQFSAVSQRYYSATTDTTKPTVLWVTPFAIYPPAHGGARRICELAKRIATHVNLVLLSDEQLAYKDSQAEDFALYYSACLLQARQDAAGRNAGTLETRMHSHAPPGLRFELNRLQAQYPIDLVQVEFMEASRLVEERQDNIAYIASLHDVYLNNDASDAAQLAVLKQYDAIVTCSEEDAGFLQDLPNSIVPNGAPDRLDNAVPSPATPGVLFMGPFRYQPNFDGILEFLQQVWPGIIAMIPDATLVILAGAEASQPRYSNTLFNQQGVNVISRYVDPAPYLSTCALTINPQQEIRGSALKVAESLLAKRVCISTAAGARGYGNLQGEALLIAQDWQQMQTHIQSLLLDTQQRHALESTAQLDRQTLGWDGQAEALLRLYRQLLPNHPWSKAG